MYLCKYAHIYDTKFIHFDNILSEVDWSKASKLNKLNNEQLYKYQDYLDWYVISRYQVLNDNLIRQYNTRINWALVSRYQKLSTQILNQYHYCLDYFWIKRCQNTEDFLYKNKLDKVSIKNLCYAFEKRLIN